MKNSNDTIVNRIRDLPVSSAVPQPIAPPRAPERPLPFEILGRVYTASQTLSSLLLVALFGIF